MKRAVLFLIATLLIASLSARSIPFDPAFLDKFHFVLTKGCGQENPLGQAITIKRDRLEYRPLIFFSTTFDFECLPWTDVFYRHRPNHLFMEKHLRFNRPTRTDPRGGIPEAVGPPCSEVQPVETYWPWGPTRKQFVNEFRTIFDGLVVNRRLAQNCTGRGSKDVTDAVFGYMYTIAYEYFITLPSLSASKK